MMPPDVVQSLKASGGWVMGSTATFGAPFYGDRFIGRLVYGESKKGQNHCTKEDYDIPSPAPAKKSEDGGATRLLHIVVVRRGECSFTTKVRIAQEKGAHAVIIVDKEDSKLTTEDMANIIVADDGFGGSVHIPSVLIAKEPGNQLIAALKADQVIVELAWNLPTNHVVKVDLWLSSASAESVMFLKDFAPMRRELNEVVSFQPHYAVFGVDANSNLPLSHLCSDASGQYCAEDPDGSGPITGQDVLAENVRQLCIHEVSKVPRESVYSVKAGLTGGVMFAEKFWAYMDHFLDNCPLNGHGSQNTFGLECSVKLMKLVDIDPALVDKCVQANTTEYLKRERGHQAWSPRALRINGWRYSGVLDPELAVKAICSGFVEVPPACNKVIHERDPFKAYIVKKKGIRVQELLVWLLGISIMMCVVMVMYKRYLKKEMRATLREEVMLEVQAQMGEYTKMQGSG